MSINQPTKPSSYITNQNQLDDVVLMIRKIGTVALDTEFTRRSTYYPILSIVQICVMDEQGQKEIFIVDCLANLDLKGLFTVIADARITKILHSAQQDLQIFYRESGLMPQRIIDTQIMSSFCDQSFNIGYSALVEKNFGVQLDKKQQNSDWQRRPLNKRQLEYAALDVFFLEEVYKKFSEILTQKNRFSWFVEEMQSFIAKALLKNDEGLTQKFSFRGKNQNQIFRIKKMILWREEQAKKNNVPRRHFMRDEVIEKIVCEEKFPKNFSKKICDEITKILSPDCEEFLPKKSGQRRNFIMDESLKALYAEGKKVIAKISSEENFDERFLINSSDLKSVVCQKELFWKKISGWRCQLYGNELAQAIAIPSKS